MLLPTLARVVIVLNASQDYQKTRNLMARQFESVTIYFWCERYHLKSQSFQQETFQSFQKETYQTLIISDIVGFMVTVEETLPTEVTIVKFFK